MLHSVLARAADRINAKQAGFLGKVLSCLRPFTV
jgi:hypothetical protein